MAHQDNDEVARALAALAGGAVPSEHETPSNGIPSESTVFDTEPVKAAAAKPLFAPNAVPATINRASATPATTPAQKPAPPAPPGAAKVARTRAPSPPPAAPAPVLPPVPIVPPVAKVRQSSTSKRPAMPTRPVAPVPAAPAAPLPVEPAAAVESDDILSEITEDDEMIAPAPDLAAFTPRARPVVVKAHLYEQTNFRRTIIPILLTGGLLLIALGAWSRLDHDGLLGGVGVGVGVLFITLGVLLIAVGVLNMLQVRHILNSANTGR